MGYEFIEKDYLDLWIYFQDKAISVKGAMFKTITWLVGFATGLIAFIFSNLPKCDPLQLDKSQQLLIGGASIAGLTICLLAFISIFESDRRIKEYWDYANVFWEKIKWPNNKISPNKVYKIAGIVRLLLIVEILFSILFLVTLILAIAK